MKTHPLLLATILPIALIGFSYTRGADDRPAPVVQTATPGGPVAGPRTFNLRQTPVVAVVRKVKGAVVNIHSERTARAPAVEELFSTAPSQNRVNGMGTGIVIDPRGYIITNQHVIEDVSVLRVRLADGTNLGARILARDSEHDLALLKISPPRPLPVMPLGTSRDIMVGETVVAIGNAYGYDHSVTVGIVSAIGRDVTLNKEVRYRSLIQTDASINPGNSGGPLVNLNGELIGVNVAIRAGAQGIGFAIPVDTMISVAGDMLARVRQQRGPMALGLGLRDAVVPAKDGEGSPTRTAIVNQLDANGPAARGGVRLGDVLVKIGNTRVATGLDLQRGLLDQDSADRLSLTVRRAGKLTRLELTLDGARAVSAPAVADPTSADQIWKKLGFRLSVADLETIQNTHPQLHGGLTLGDIRAGSPAAKAGLKTGDILVGLHQWETLTLDNVTYVLNHADRATFTPIKFFILRAGQVHRGQLGVAD
jgi:serine protease Do